VLFLARLIPEKRATLGVAAIALATLRIEGLRGEFLGDGPERAALERAIAEHGLQQVVSAPGFADAETVDTEMRRALCMLLPSRREGYGMVVVEAAARGTPSIVVAGEDNAATELITEGVNGTIAARADPQALAREMIVETTHPTAGQVASLGLPIKFSETPGSVRRAAPVLGQHTREVLREYGFSDTEADQMAALGAIEMSDPIKAAKP